MQIVTRKSVRGTVPSPRLSKLKESHLEGKRRPPLPNTKKDAKTQDKHSRVRRATAC
jgi:hypothetical protein